jgi:predicted PurR-regulated permease PerM
MPRPRAMIPPVLVMIADSASDQFESSISYIPSTKNQVEKGLDPYLPTHRSLNLSQNLKFDDTSNASSDMCGQ